MTCLSQSLDGLCSIKAEHPETKPVLSTQALNAVLEGVCGHEQPSAKDRNPRSNCLICHVSKIYGPEPQKLNEKLQQMFDV